MSQYKYKYELNGTRIYPILPKGSSRRWQRPDGKVYFREEINATLIITRGDFDSVVNVSIDTQLELVISKIDIDVVNGNSYVEYARGTFYKTDVENIDEDRYIVRVKLDSIDKYKKLLDAVDREVDLIKDLSPVPYTVQFTKEPLIQIVFPYHNQMMNICGHAVWTTQLATIYTSTELEAYGFTHEAEPMVFIPGGGQISPDVAGIYTQSGINEFTRLDGNYILSRFEIDNWTIRDAVGGTVRYRSDDNTVPGDGTLLDRDPFLPGFKLYKVGDSSVEIMPFPVWHHQRVLTDVEEFLGSPTLDKPTDDIDGLALNYKYLIDATTLPGFMFVLPSDNSSGTSTAYGRFIDEALFFAGEYFAPVIDLLGSRTHPVMRESWTQYLIIAYLNPLFDITIQGARSTVTLKHAYKLSDVTKLLAAHLDPSIVYDSTTAHSDFLHNGTNPLTGEGQSFEHFITPKTNILVGTYNNAATKAPITFQQLEEVYDRLQAKFYIDNAYALRIEHYQYFKNGRNYNVQVVGAGLTVQEEPRVDKPWAYHTRRYSYKKQNMPQFLSFPWMDQTSEIFDGVNIEHLSPFVDTGRTSEQRVSNFTSDITFGQTLPENTSKDGFYIFNAGLVEGTYTVPFITLAVPDGGPDAEVQNGFWSNVFIHDNFWRHQLACVSVRLNNEEIEAMSIRRLRVQDVQIPVQPDPMRLVESALGVGEIEEMEEDMITGLVKIKVMHDIE